MNQPTIARRDLLKGAAALVVAVTVPPISLLTTAEASLVARTLNPAQLDTWLAIAANGTITGYWGKMDMGQGVDTAIAQIIAEELDVDVDNVNIIAADSALCADQGVPAARPALTAPVPRFARRPLKPGSSSSKKHRRNLRYQWASWRLPTVSCE